MAKANVSEYNGSPAIIIDSKVYPPMMATIRSNDKTRMVIDKDYYKSLGESGIKIFFLICDTEWLKPGAFEMFTQDAEALLEAVPDAYIMLRIGMHPPVKWCKQNPDELVSYSDKKPKKAQLYTESFEAEYPAIYSLCSEKWRHDAGKALMETYDKIEALPYADRIIGYFFAAGGTSEWYYITPTEYTPKTSYLDTGGFEQTDDTDYNNVYADFSPAFKKEFSKYLRAKYETNENLKKAWKNDAASIDDPPIPDCTKRYFINGVDYDIDHPEKVVSTSKGPTPPSNGTNIGQFIDIASHMDVYDFFRAWHIGTANSVIYFGSLIKQRCNDKLTGAFYGSAGSTKYFSFSQIGAVTNILDSGAIDFLASPGVYENRQPGGFTGERQPFDSFRIRNRMFISEDDSRTHLEYPYIQNCVEMYDIDDTRNLLKRQFGAHICRDIQAWWFDQHIGGGRYKDPQIYELFKQQRRIADEAYECDRRKVSEIAFIYDEESYHLISEESSHQMTELFNNYEIDKIGAPADRYFKKDLADPRMPDYKLYVFLNSISVSDKQRKAIHAKLAKNNAVALFMYASGAVNPDSDNMLCAENIAAFTGISTKCDPNAHKAKFKINGTPHKITDGLVKGEIYGEFTRKMWANFASVMNCRIKPSSVTLYPLFYTDDPDSVVAAYFLDSGKSALTIKENGTFTSIYCGSKHLDCSVIKEIARFAHCHIYSESDDVLYVNRNYITIHAASTGKKEIKLLGKHNVYEAYENKCYGENTDVITFDIIKGETKMFRLQRL